MTALKSLRVCASLLAALCAAAPAVAQSFDQAIVLYFGAGDTRLGPDDVAIAGAAANYVRNCAGPALVLVTGHDDAAGSVSDALITSELRARAVAAAIDEAGVPSEAIRLDWKGETDLAQPTPDGVAEALNRRVTIEVDCDGGGGRERVGRAWGATDSVGSTPVGGATQASTVQPGSPRRPAPPPVPVTIIQQLGDQRCPIQARGVTRWENEDDLSNTNIVTDVEIFHQCATHQLIEVNMNPYNVGSLSGFNEPVLSGLGGLAHAWPAHLPLPVAWPAYNTGTVPMPPNWNPLSVGISQEVSQRRDIQIQVAVCEAFTTNGKKRALLIESGSYMGQGFRHIACVDVPPPYNEPN